MIGLDAAAPELLFGDERLTNLRRLMESGCYGRLETVIPPDHVPAWMSMATSQDAGSLGVYGPSNRTDHSYTGIALADSGSAGGLTIWDQIAREGKRSVIIGAPPWYPPREDNGVCIRGFATPEAGKVRYPNPSSLKDETRKVAGDDYPVDVSALRGGKKDWLKDQIYDISRKHFSIVRHYLQSSEWDYFHFVEMGLDRLQHGFWRFHDPSHALYSEPNRYQTTITDYYRYLDEEIGALLELLDDETAVLVLSDHGAQRADGGFCINEWLVKEGLLVLNEYPKAITARTDLSINWDKTRVWGEGGYCARIFLNVKGRGPNGIIDRADYERVREEVRARLEASQDEAGQNLGARAFKPEEIYRRVRGVAPDLIAHFGGLRLRAIEGVGYKASHIPADGPGLGGCNHSQYGGFILASPNNPLSGEIEGAHILDLAPTLLELSGHDVPASMQGKSLVSGKAQLSGDSNAVSEEELVRERLSGLGYIS